MIKLYIEHKQTSNWELMANLQIVEAGKNVEAQYVEMMVPLYSYGCDKKIKKALANFKEIYLLNFTSKYIFFLDSYIRSMTKARLIGPTESFWSLVAVLLFNNGPILKTLASSFRREQICIYSVNVDYHQQKVTVWGICDKNDVLTIVKNKRRGARFWNSEDGNKLQFHESHSAPQSPQSSSNTKNATRYFAMIKRQSFKLNLSAIKRESLKLDLSVIKRTSSLNWKSLKKVFVRSNSF
ncbi:hypothetical protein CASFOL_023741 [Castilleja foliolosa]|uniref:Uncharacterized protein n=1 Tax=Castilleja foliolosa TaxID=1961234 RepID=A0ABD3CMR5_9LAMI